MTIKELKEKLNEYEFDEDVHIVLFIESDKHLVMCSDFNIGLDADGEVYVYDTYPTLILRAVTLPKGHGQCIDVDASVRVTWSDGTIHSTTVSRLLHMHSLLDFPKTIIPAEGDMEDS